MRTRGKGFKKEIWFSFCSMHAIHDENCNMCNTGSWNNAIKYKVSSLIYDLFPSLWRWWVNFDVTTEECLIITNKIKEPQISRIIKVTKISNGWSCDECVNLITTFTDESFCNLGFKNAKKNYCGGKDFKQK